MGKARQREGGPEACGASLGLAISKISSLFYLVPITRQEESGLGEGVPDASAGPYLGLPGSHQ
jgi:hypothetical protein